MYLVCSTLPFRDQPLSVALNKMASLGVKRVELCVDGLHSDARQWDITPESLIHMIQELEISVNSIHVPIQKIPEGASNNEEQNISTETTLRTIDLASFLGAGLVVQHVRLFENPSNLKKWNIVELSAPNLLKASFRAASKNIRIALENVPTTSARMLGNGAAELNASVDMFPPETMGICMDISHCVASGLDSLEFLDMINHDRLFSIHASDNITGQLKDQHLTLGRGDVSWEEILNRLRKHNYRGSFVIEVSGSGKGLELRNSLDYLRKLGITH